MTSNLVKVPFQQRQPSRPNSASSHHISTGQRAASSPRPGLASRPDGPGLGSQSPVHNPLVPTNISSRNISPDIQRISPEKKRRSSAVYTKSESRHGSGDVTGNPNRWSQSTTSSHASAGNKRRNSFSKRFSESLGSFSGFTGSQTSTSQSKPQGKTRSPLTMNASPIHLLSPPMANAPTLPPIEALSSLSQAVDSADSPSTPATATPTTADLLTSTTSTAQNPDYFGERWNPNSSSGSSFRMQRTSTAPSPRVNAPAPLDLNPGGRHSKRIPESVYSPQAAIRLKQERRSSQNNHHRRRADSTKSNGTAEGESSASDHRERSGRQQRRRAPSQKALLSKALAKANHAVVLDGQQNVEGAILAYGDACNLLRQVMVRSSGDEDRRKLETVVRRMILTLREA